MYDCKHCRDSGREPCTRCGATGMHPSAAMDGRDCPTCKGRGWVVCECLEAPRGLEEDRRMGWREWR